MEQIVAGVMVQVVAWIVLLQQDAMQVGQAAWSAAWDYAYTASYAPITAWSYTTLALLVLGAYFLAWPRSIEDY